MRSRKKRITLRQGFAEPNPELIERSRTLDERISCMTLPLSKQQLHRETYIPQNSIPIGNSVLCEGFLGEHRSVCDPDLLICALLSQSLRVFRHKADVKRGYPFEFIIRLRRGSALISSQYWEQRKMHFVRAISPQKANV